MIMPALEKNVCTWIYRRRKQLKISRQNFADQLGISYECVRLWETFHCSPRLNKIEQIAKHLGSSVEYLLVGHSSVLDSKS